MADAQSAKIYMQAVKRVLNAQYGNKVSPRRVLEMTVATVRPGEFTPNDLNTTFTSIFPHANSCGEYAIANYRECLDLLSRKNQRIRETVR